MYLNLPNYPISIFLIIHYLALLNLFYLCKFLKVHIVNTNDTIFINIFNPYLLILENKKFSIKLTIYFY